MDYLKGAFSLEVMDDNYDPWGMTVSSFTDSLGNFKLLSDSEAARFSMLKEEIPAVKLLKMVMCVLLLKLYLATMIQKLLLNIFAKTQYKY